MICHRINVDTPPPSAATTSSNRWNSDDTSDKHKSINRLHVCGFSRLARSLDAEANSTTHPSCCQFVQELDTRLRHKSRSLIVRSLVGSCDLPCLHRRACISMCALSHVLERPAPCLLSRGSLAVRRACLIAMRGSFAIRQAWLVSMQPSTFDRLAGAHRVSSVHPRDRAWLLVAFTSQTSQHVYETRSITD